MSNWINIGHVDDIPRLGARVVPTEQGDIAIFRTADNTVFALADRCPHRNGPLSQGIVHGHIITCPLHNWRINLNDGTAISPDEGCTRSFQIQVDANGQLFLDVSLD